MNLASEGMSSTKAEDCFRKEIEKAFAEGKDTKGVKLGDVSVGELNVTAPESVAETKAWQLALDIEVTSGDLKGESITAYLDLVALREGDSIATLSAQDVLSPFDSDLRNQLLETLAAMTAQPSSE